MTRKDYVALAKAISATGDHNATDVNTTAVDVIWRIAQP